MRTHSPHFDVRLPLPVFARVRAFQRALLAMLLIGAATQADAASYIWTQSGNATQDWTVGSNWSGSSVDSGPGTTSDILTFFADTTTAFAASGNTTITTSVPATLTMNVLTLNGLANGSGNNIVTIGSNASTWTLGGTTPTVNLNGLNNGSRSLTYTVGPNLTMGANTLFTGNGNATFNVSGNITGAYSLTKNGSSTLTLSGNNTYSGGTTINAGTLVAASAMALGTGNVANYGTMNLTAGAVTYTGLDNTGAGALSGNGVVNLTLGTGSNQATLNGNYSSYTGTWNIGIGAIGGRAQMNGADNAAATINVLSNATLYVSTAVTKNAALVLNGGDTGESYGQLRIDGGATWSGAITLAGNITGNGDYTIGSNTGTNIISGNISESGGSRGLSKGGSAQITLSGTNTYTGNTTVAAGTLQFAKSVSLYNANTASWTASNLVVNSGATAAFNVGGTGEFTASDMNILAGLGTASGGFKSGSTLLMDTTNAASAVNITAAIANPSVTKLGAGSLTLSGANSFTGLLKFTGTVALASSTAWGTGAGGIQLGNNVNAASDSGNLVLATGAALTGTPAVTTKHGAGGASVTDTITFDAPTSTAGYTQNFGVLNLDQMTTLIITQTGNLSSQATANFTSTTLTTVNNSRSWTINATGVAVNLGNATMSSSQNPSTLYLDGNSTGNTVGAITQPGGSLNLYKKGAGTWTITSGGGNYTGYTRIDAGTLSISSLANGGSNSAIGAATNANSNLILQGGTLQYTGAAVSTDRLFSLAVSSAIDASGTGAVNFTNTGAIGFNGGTAAKTLTLTGNNTGANTIAAIIGDNTGATSLTKSGTGTWVLAGTNTYTGATTINAGTLSISTLANGGSASNIGQSSNASTNLILNGGTLQYTGAAVSTDRLFSLQSSSTIDASGTGAVNFTNAGLMGFNSNTAAKTLTLTGNNTASNTITAIIGNNTGATSITKSGTGTWVLAGTNTYTGATTINAGTLTVNGGSAIGDTSAVSVGSGAVFNLGASETVGSIAGAGNVTLGAYTLTVGGDNSSTTLSGVASGTGGALTKNGTGSLTLSGANTYTGATTINAGTLSVSALANGGSPSNIGQSSNASTNLILNGGTLQYTGAAVSTDRLFSLQSSSTIDASGSGALNFTNTGSMGFNSGTAAKTLTLTGNNTGSNTIAAIIGDNTGATSITKTGTGTWVLSGNNSYTGVTTINSGTLSASILANGSVASSIGASTTNIVLNGGTLLYTGGNVTTDRGYTLNANTNSTINVSNASTTLTLTSVSSGNGSLTKDGVGTLQLNQSYSAGTVTVNNGAFNTNGGNDGFNPASGSIVINSGGTVNLLNSNRIQNNVIITINSGGTFNAGAYYDTIGGLTGNGTFSASGGGYQTFTLPQNLTFDGKLTGSDLRLLIQNTSSLNTNNSARTFTLTNTTSDATSSTSVWGIGGNDAANAANLGDTTLKLGANEVIPDAYVLRIWGSSAASGNGSYQNALDMNGFNETIGGLLNGDVSGTGTNLGLVTNSGAANSTLTLNLTSARTFNGTIADGATNNIALVKTGSSTQTLNGANTYSGGTTIKNGSIIIGAGNDRLLTTGSVTLGDISTTGKLVLGDGTARNQTLAGLTSTGSGGSVVGGAASNSTLTLNIAGTNTFGGTLGGTGTNENNLNLTKTGIGTLTLSGNNTYVGTTTINAGTLAINHANALGTTGNITFGGGALQYGSAITTDISSRIKNSASAISIDTNSNNVTFASALDSSNSLGLTKNGSGTLTLSGNNTYSGATTTSGGTLKFAKTGSLYNGTESSWTASNISVASGATLALNVGGTGEFSTGNITTLLTNLGGAVNNNGLMSGSTIAFDTTNASGNSFTIADTIANSTGTGGGVIGLGKLGTNTLVLSANNTFSGGTTITAGTLSLSSTSGSAGSGNISISSGAALQLANTAATTVGNNLSGAGDVLHTSAYTTTLSGSNTNSGTIRSTGGGTLVFSGANALSTSLTSLNATTGSTLSFADGATRTITLGSSGISLSTAALSFDVDNSISDRLNFGGAASLTGTNTINLSFLNSISSAQTWTLLTAASGSLAGTWNLGTYTLQPGYTFALSSNATALWLTANVSVTDAYWTGSNGTSWTGTNFSTTINGTASLAGSGLTSSSDVRLAGTGAGNLTTTLGSNYTIGTLTITTPEVTINGTNTLTVNSSSASAINISATGNTNIGAILAGSAGLTKSGSGTLTLGGNNTYSGGSTITGGTVVFNTSNAFGNSTRSITVNPGGANTATLKSGAASLTISNNITLTAGTAAFDTNSNNTTVSGVISGSGSLTKNGAGALTLSGNNTFNGGFTLNTGTLTIGLSSTASGGVVSSGATGSGNVTLNGGSISATASNLNWFMPRLNIAGDVTYTGVSAGGYTYIGATTIDLGSATRILTANNTVQTITVTGNTASGSNQLHLTAPTGGTLTIQNGVLDLETTLTGSTYAGVALYATPTWSNATLTIGQNVLLSVQSNKAIGGVALTINTGGIFNMAANNGAAAQTVASLSGGGSVYAGMTANDTTNHSLTINNTSGSTNFSGLISNGPGTGALSVIKSGASTQILSGSNNYTGSTTINAGTLQLGNGSTTGSLSTSSSITVNGTLAFNRSNDAVQGTDFSSSAISGTGSLVQMGTGNLTLNAANTYSGGTTLNSGTLVLNNNSAIGNGTLTINGGTLNNTNAGLITLSNNNTQNWNGDFAFTGTNDLNMGTGAVSMNASRTVTINGGTLTIGGAISGAGYGLTKAGSGTLILSGNNTYTGATTVSTGNLSISATSAVANTSGINLANGAVLLYTGSNATLNRAISVTSGTGTIRNDGTGLLTLSGGLSKNGSTLTLQGGTNGINVSSAITGSASNSDLIIDGGSVTLANANTYNGPTFLINGATLNANTAGALPTSTLSAVTINGSSTLALGASQSVASLSGTSGSSVNLNANTLTINGSSSTTYSGGISGTGNLVKNGSGTQTLAGATTFNGTTTINSGTLQAATANALANTSQVVLNNGGSFLVTAANAVNDSAAVNLNGGTLAVNGAFEETVGQLTLSANSTIDLAGFAGTLRFGGVGSWASGTNLAIWNWNGINEYGTAVGNGLNNRHVVFTNNSGLDSYLDRISFYSDSGSSFVGNAFAVNGFTPGGGTEIIAVPEPESYATACILLLAIGFVQSIRRRAKQKLLDAHPPA